VPPDRILWTNKSVAKSASRSDPIGQSKRRLGNGYLSVRRRSGWDPFDPHDNILAIVTFLREIYDRYGSPGSLAACNPGLGSYEDYRDHHGPLSSETVA
jgi:hypothetical protein